MVPRAALRAALFASVMFAIWSFSRSAAAGAALCDDRGASATAEPPALEAPGEAIQRARLGPRCPTRGDLPLASSVAPCRGGPALSFSGVDQAVDPVAPKVASAAPVRAEP